MSAYHAAKLFVFAAVIANGAVTSSGAQSIESKSCKPAEVTEFGQTFLPAMILDKRHIYSPRRVDAHMADGSVAAMRILIGIGDQVKDRDWSIVVRNALNGVLATFDPRDFENADGQLSLRRWTGRFDESAIYLELQAGKDSDVVVEIIEGLATPSTSEKVRLFSIQGDAPKWQLLYSVPLPLARAGDSVGILVTGNEVPPGKKHSPAWCCSGVMLTHDLFLTNWHCGGNSDGNGAYWTSAVCGRAVIDLGWSKESLSRQYGCKEIVASDRDLDFALIRVLPVLGPAGYSSRPSKTRVQKSLPGALQDVFLVHHAKCSFKLISKDCRVQTHRYKAWTGGVRGDASILPDFTHDCDSESGASGAPVFDLSGSIIGVHHAGFDRNSNCESIDHVNKAVSIGAILEHIQLNHPDVAKEIGG